MPNHRPLTIRDESGRLLGPTHSCHEGSELNCCTLLGTARANGVGYACAELKPPEQQTEIEPPIGEPIQEPATQTEALQNMQDIQQPKPKCSC